MKQFTIPFTYRSPLIAAIKEKVGEDAVKVQQETMKLYQQVGVSPLSGCVPLLLQMPILMSVFFLFPNMLMFRQKNFLWANDLSTYDSLINWGFNLPIIGHHISLFVVLMTISSLAFTYYNLGDLSKAIGFIKKAIRIFDISLPPTHPNLLNSKRSLAPGWSCARPC